MVRGQRVELFRSIEEENREEHARRARLDPARRMAEFAALQERAWGPGWTAVPIDRVASWERVDWWQPPEEDPQRGSVE